MKLKCRLHDIVVKCVGHFETLRTLPFSCKLDIITIVRVSCSQTICQKSVIVFGSGAK